MRDWTPAFPLSKLAVGGSKVFKRGREQVAVFRLDEDALYAVDNRCPHEGYPLVQGALKDCTLTCRWHNYKFDLRDGACLKGDESVRTFPVRVADGVVELDLTPPDHSATLPSVQPMASRGDRGCQASAQGYTPGASDRTGRDAVTSSPASVYTPNEPDE